MPAFHHGETRSYSGLGGDPSTLRDTHIDPVTHGEGSPSHSGPQRPCLARGWPHVITPDTGVTPSHTSVSPHTTEHPGYSLSPTTGFVTPWTGGDRRTPCHTG